MTTENILIKMLGKKSNMEFKRKTEKIHIVFDYVENTVKFSYKFSDEEKELSMPAENLGDSEEAEIFTSFFDAPKKMVNAKKILKGGISFDITNKCIDDIRMKYIDANDYPQIFSTKAAEDGKDE